MSSRLLPVRACAAVIALIGVATAVLQSSIFGFASMFPPIYSQAVMSGQGFAGIVASVLRIVTLVCGVFPVLPPPCPPCRDGRGLWTQGWDGGGMWGAQHSTAQYRAQAPRFVTCVLRMFP